jgi:ribosome biogenesis GTPase / thiamine phosphate phosphatase
MTQIMTLAGLGWTDFFQSQLHDADAALTAVRVAGVHRGRIDGLSIDGPVTLPFTGATSAGDLAIGDWVLSDAERICRVLERKTELSRRAAGHGNATQLIAANVDTLFIVTSCNADFNAARLERYLALSAEAGSRSVILLTKADTSVSADTYRTEAARLQRDLPVLTLDARDPMAAQTLAAWCGHGQTVALLGSSGVGKTTLANTLTGHLGQTGPIRENDARGRHTTTIRSLHAITTGGWLIDTPGMRALSLADAAGGIDAVFQDVTDLVGHCRFRDCLHQSEPGCAVRQAIANGTLDEDRLNRWNKLKTEDRQHNETPHEARERIRKFGKQVKTGPALRSRHDGKP